MTLSRDQVVEVLQVAAMTDKRAIGETDILAWTEAAEIGRWATREDRPNGTWGWSNALALAAVRHHYATSTAYLMPGHVTEFVARQRRIEAPSKVVAALPSAPPASPGRIDSLIAEVGQRLGWRRQERHPALGARCSHCGAREGKPCVRRRTRGPHAGELKPLPMPHDTRVQTWTDQTTEG